MRNIFLQVHGSPEGLEKMRRKRNLSYSDRLRARLSDEMPQQFRSGQRMLEEKSGAGMKSSAGRVVRVAMLMNLTDAVFKFCGWILTGSHSLFAEAIHSGVDTLNQVLYAIFYLGAFLSIWAISIFNKSTSIL